jgi:serine/threonine protein kinase
MVLTDDVRFPHHISRNARDFVSRLMAKDQLSRLGSGTGGVDEIKNHPFFTPLNWADVRSKAITPEWVPGPVAEPTAR